MKSPAASRSHETPAISYPNLLETAHGISAPEDLNPPTPALIWPQAPNSSADYGRKFTAPVAEPIFKHE